MIRTSGGQVILHVEKIRVLGMLLERSRVNGKTINRLTAKVNTAMRLIKRVSSRRAEGMKEASLSRMVQSFPVSYTAYVAAFHNWKVHERNRINAFTRRAYKAALGLFDCASTEKLLSPEVLNTLEEIAEVPRTTQLERFSGTRTSRQVLRNLGLEQGRADEEIAEAEVPEGVW
ncbi:hypothetical protein HPB50_020730 [Hyalomma asiaticum]|uniref:Uncharacterized protein n=1 Tax=Hyalomma asiaticum TaxID=266040 RepID=A0ACB7TNU4_HYAAI|nr:hypothetical protein HPB50_020730 [Hyalomma asiaticum]